jgi:hypothetical protein
LSEIKGILNNFEPVFLKDMGKVSLMNRQDTKYVFSVDLLPAILLKLSEFYNILEIDELRQMSYSNVYFDTDDFMFYNNHHRGKMNRYKIRNRRYDDSDLTFCEVKFKSNKSRTQKERKVIESLSENFDEVTTEFLDEKSPIKVEDLSAKLFMDFKRITLVHKTWQDRCTLDLELKANNKVNEFEFKGIVIAEIKQEKFSPQCDFNQVLRSEKIYPKGFSKYCMSMVKLYSELKSNRFKPRIMMLDKLINKTK